MLGGGREGDGEGYGKRMEGRDMGWWWGSLGSAGCLGGWDASSECVDVTSWLWLNIQE